MNRTEASAAVAESGWRLILGWFAASIEVDSLASGAVLAAELGADPAAPGHLRIDLRDDRVELALTTWAQGWVTDHDVDLARRIAGHVAGRGLRLAPPVTRGARRPVEGLELAIDTLDADAIRPFWRAVLGMVDDGSGALVDPAGQLPPIWFQQMQEPRPERNRIHFDITVADDEAWPRVEAALAAGGRMVDDSAARMFWVLADVEGNEVCVCTWLDRDERQR